VLVIKKHGIRYSAHVIILVGATYLAHVGTLLGFLESVSHEDRSPVESLHEHADLHTLSALSTVHRLCKIIRCSQLRLYTLMVSRTGSTVQREFIEIRQTWA
jgi:hypothetical protein